MNFSKIVGDYEELCPKMNQQWILNMIYILEKKAVKAKIKTII